VISIKTTIYEAQGLTVTTGIEIQRGQRRLTTRVGGAASPENARSPNANVRVMMSEVPVLISEVPVLIPKTPV